MSFREFFVGAGMGIWPTLFLGLAALVLAGGHALKPRPNWMPLIVGTASASVLCGLLATITGFLACFSALVNASSKTPGGLPDLPVITLAGITESLGNLEVALVAATLVALLAGIGSYRARLQSAAA